MPTFGEKLRVLRKKRGLTRQQLGDMLGVHNSHIVRMEKGNRKPSVDLVLKIAEVFRVTPNQLMLDDQEVD